MQGVIILTDNPRDATPLQSALVREGYRVTTCCHDEDSILEAVEQLTPEVIIVDCRNEIVAASECRRIFATEYNLKELLVVALISKEQTTKMDWVGIDDFLLFPLDMEELLVRLRFLLWRSRNISSDNAIKIGDLLIDMKNYTVSVAGAPIELTYKEFELLRFMATRRGRVFTREALLDHVWGYDYYGGTRTVDVHIRRIRAKLGPTCENLIETVRNVGYRFAL